MLALMRLIFIAAFLTRALGGQYASYDIPEVGFYTALSSHGTVCVHIHHVVESKASCESLDFQNLPVNNTSPLVGSSTLKRLKETYNGRSAWSNGIETLSFVHSGEHGTWILGNEPGMDNGFVYLKPSHVSLQPSELESDEISWFWNLEGVWTKTSNVRLICKDTDTPNNNLFFLIEYQNSVSGDITEGYLIHSSEAGVYFLLDGAGKDKAVVLQSLKLIIPLGAPVMLSSTVDEARYSWASLIVSEHNNGGWGLSFRRMKMAGEKNPQKRDYAWRYVEDVRVSLSGRGALSGYTVRLLHADEWIMLRQSFEQELRSVVPGAYVWLYYYNVKPLLLSQLGNEKDKDQVVQGVDKVLLKCIAARGNGLVFQSFPDDRRDQMTQSALSRDGDMFHYKFRSDSIDYDRNDSCVDVGQLSTPTIQIHDAVSLSRRASIANAIVIGENPIAYLRKTITEHQRTRRTGLSPCYFYHALVTFPQPFIYAAEIICVLLGAKPLTLIQYTSDSDHQWKFPLVSELSRGLIAAKLLLGDALDVEHRVHTYEDGGAQTLIFYRSKKAIWVDNLLPRGLSQALHPMPYPSKDNPTEDYKQQIYNAYWNGIMLGYPERFVESYCISFHNDLGEAERWEEIHRAVADLKVFMEENGVEPYELSLGLDSPVNDALWGVLGVA